MLKTSKVERALIAVAMDGVAVIVATDGAWIAADVDNISSDPDEIGIEPPSESGLYLWEGKGRQTSGTDEFEMEYTGTFRRVRPDELECLLKMTPLEDTDED